MNILKSFVCAVSLASVSSPAISDEAPQNQGVERYKLCANIFSELRDIRALFDFVGAELKTKESIQAFERVKRQFEPDIRVLQENRDRFCTDFIA
jgi:hypothetical protein